MITFLRLMNASLEDAERWWHYGWVSDNDHLHFLYRWQNDGKKLALTGQIYAPDCPPIEIEYRECDPAEFKF